MSSRRTRQRTAALLVGLAFTLGASACSDSDVQDAKDFANGAIDDVAKTLNRLSDKADQAYDKAKAKADEVDPEVKTQYNDALDAAKRALDAAKVAPDKPDTDSGEMTPAVKNSVIEQASQAAAELDYLKAEHPELGDHLAPLDASLKEIITSLREPSS